MTTQEIIDSGFFRNIISEYADYHRHYENQSKDTLIYVLCDTDEEKKIATLEEIAIIKRKIRDLGHEDISIDFLTRYKKMYPNDPTKDENKDDYWIDHFHQYFTNEIVYGLSPITVASLKIEETEGDIDWDKLDEETSMAIEKFDSLSVDDSVLLFEYEKEIMSQVVADINLQKENGDWEIDIDFYEQYRDSNETLDLLFTICELLSHLFRLDIFKDLLDYSTQELIINPLRGKLQEYGFFDLPLIKPLSYETQMRIFDHINSNKVPYVIAFFDYIGFIKHLEKVHFHSKYKLHKTLANLLRSNERTIKGNINSMFLGTTENKTRYTAHLHKEQVGKYYDSLK